jgi:hypothetical protein
MFRFASGPLCYRRLGLALLLPQLGLFLFGLPPFQSGIWLQTEPIFLVVLIFAALTALWLSAGIIKGWLVQQPAHPLFLCLLLWVGWQFLATLGASSPWRSWFGPPQTGEGVAFYVAMLLIFMLAYPLWRMAAYRRLILGTALAAIAAECLLHWLHPSPSDPWKPGRWPAYLAFMAGYLWIAVMATPGSKALQYCIMIVLMYTALYTSWNKSAILLLAGAMTFSTLLQALQHKHRLQRFLRPAQTWRMLAIAACLLPMAWVFASAHIASKAARMDDLSALTVLADRNESIGSRIPFYQLIFSTMEHEPRRWLIGDGWGRFTDDALKYALVDGVQVFQNGQRRPNWFMVDGNAFHSHIQPLEALLSLGLPGMLLWFALPVIALWYLPRRYFWHIAPMLVGLTMLSYLWFEIPQVMPYHALGLAALGSLGSRRSFALPAGWLQPALAVTVLLMSGSVYAQYDAIRYGSKLSQAMETGAHEDYPLEWLTDDQKRGGDRFRASAMHYGMQVGNATAVDDNMVGWYRNLMKAASIMASAPAPIPRDSGLNLWLHYKLLMDFGDPVFAPLRREAAASLPGAVLQAARQAPLRNDLAAFFLMSLDDYTGHDIKRQADILSEILRISPDHRGALWLMGNILIRAEGHEAVGHDMLKHAVALGASRVYPITDQELRPYLQDN